MWKEKLRNIWLLFVFLNVRLLISLRYKIKIEGLENLTKDALKKSGGILFLPNHPAEIDPIIMMMVLWKRFHPRVLVVDYMFNVKTFRYFLRLIRALAVPNMDIFVNKWKSHQLDKVFAETVKRLKSGENFLIYPSGRLKLTGIEALGGAFFVHDLVKACPEANVVLVRTTGLWGSMFSRAQNGKVPDMGKTLLEGAKILLKNGIFFTPRRTVKIEISLAPNDFPFAAERAEFNKYLESWYNRYPYPGLEPMVLVPYKFWKKELPKVELIKSKASDADVVISPEVQKDVIAHLAALSRRSPHQIERNMNLSLDLGLDSFDIAQLYVFLDERFDVADLTPGELQTVEDLLRAASGKKREREKTGEERRKQAFWPKESGRLDPCPPMGKTIVESFFLSCNRMKGMTACADALVGPISYRKLLATVVILAKKIKQIPGPNIGILLPASVGTYATIMACLVARKVPVVLNWTAGVRSLDHAANITGLSAVLSAKRFLNRLENGELGKIEEMFQYMEDIRESVSLKEKILGFFLAMRSPKHLLKTFKLENVKEEEPAVILFTSGTESLPKAVPLTNKNIISNLSSALKRVTIKESDIYYGVLPPFHSFGFSPSGIMSFMLGLKIFYAPDPTDSHGMAHDIAEWKPTLFCCAPSFTKALFRVADPKMLESVRLFVMGAEKTPLELFEYVKKLGSDKILLEGYGITECGPIVAFDYPDRPHRGVGYPLDDVEICVIDSETSQVLSRGKEGEICIRGPSVFSGYLGPNPSPFLQLDGKRWYRSGDRGYLDEEGALILSGRLKRFVKIAGEMVSLGGLEEELFKMAKMKNWRGVQSDGPSLAVSVREKETDKPLIILYTTFDISKEEVNSALKESGYGRIVKIAEVKQLKEIPLTGTGKTHYRLLDEMYS